MGEAGEPGGGQARQLGDPTESSRAQALRMGGYRAAFPARPAAAAAGQWTSLSGEGSWAAARRNSTCFASRTEPPTSCILLHPISAWGKASPRTEGGVLSAEQRTQGRLCGVAGFRTFRPHPHPAGDSPLTPHPKQSEWLLGSPMLHLQRELLEALAARKPVFCAPKAVMKTLKTTVMKTRTVAALLSWFSLHWFSTSFRFSRAVEQWGVGSEGQGGGHSHCVERIVHCTPVCKGV